MSHNSKRNRLWHAGVTYREISGTEDKGFVIRVLDRETAPSQITTAVKQPGQQNIAVQTVEAEEHYVGTQRRLLYGANPIESIGLNGVVVHLRKYMGSEEDLQHQTAALALHQIISVAEIREV